MYYKKAHVVIIASGGLCNILTHLFDPRGRRSWRLHRIYMYINAFAVTRFVIRFNKHDFSSIHEKLFAVYFDYITVECCL